MNDLVDLILIGIKDSKLAAEAIAWHFVGDSTLETAKNIHAFLRRNVQYIQEDSNHQTVKTLSRLLVRDRFGDCKHFATATATLLKALNIPCSIRLASYSSDKDYTHVYCVVHLGKKLLPVDCVLKGFGTQAKYYRAKDLRIC